MREHHALGVDIVDAQAADLPHAQPRAVREHQRDAMVGAAHGAEQSLDLGAAEHDRDTHRHTWPRKTFELVWSVQRHAVQKAQRAAVDAESGRGQPPPGQVKEKRPHLAHAHRARRAAKVLGELACTSHVDIDRCDAHPSQREILTHPVT